MDDRAHFDLYLLLRKEKSYQEHVASSLDLLNIVRFGQLEVALGVKASNVGEKFGAVVFAKLCSKRVDGNVQRAAISLKLTITKQHKEFG